MKWLYEAWRANTLYDWSTAGLLLVAAMLALAVVRYIAARLTGAVAKRTATKLDDHAAQVISRTRLWLFFPVALYAGASALALPVKLERLIDFLVANRRGERFLLGSSSTRLAAPIIIETGQPVMAMGGFHGLDPILAPARLARMVETRQVRFVMLGDLSPVSRVLGGEVASRPIADWVRANGTMVDPELWRPASTSRRGTGGLQLYDLRSGAMK